MVSNNETTESKQSKQKHVLHQRKMLRSIMTDHFISWEHHKSLFHIVIKLF